MKAFKITTLIIISLVFGVIQGWALDGEEGVIDQLKRDITLLNLLNGLNLTDGQTKELLKLAREADAIRNKLKEGNKAQLKEFEDALTRLKEGLMGRDLRPSADTERKAAILNHRLKAIRDEGMEELRVVEERVKGVLTPGQLSIVENFKPCLIPPKDLKNPSRAGQAFDPAPLEGLLIRVKEIPEERFHRNKERLVSEYINRIERQHGPMTEAEREAMVEEFMAVVEKARTITDEEFALNREELAARINPGDKRMEIFRKAEAERKGLGRAGRFLLDERIIPILEKRLALSSKPTKGNTLSSIKPAYNGETCSIGKEKR